MDVNAETARKLREMGAAELLALLRGHLPERRVYNLL